MSASSVLEASPLSSNLVFEEKKKWSSAKVPFGLRFLFCFFFFFVWLFVFCLLMVFPGSLTLSSPLAPSRPAPVGPHSLFLEDSVLS